MSPTPAKARGTESPDAREVERRIHCRYPITLDVQYKLLATHSGEQIGIGKTVNVSSGGVLFEATDSLPARSPIELFIDWPLLKEGAHALKLVIYGRVIRSDGQLAAVRVNRHEFRL
jgi:hypothetical protein